MLNNNNKKNDDDSSFHVLVVDDDRVDLKAIRRSFERAKITCPLHWAKDGIEALEMLRGKGGMEKLRPNMLIIDLNMPRMGGLELIHTIREDQQLKDCLIYVLTTSKRSEDIKSAYDLNITGYIFKEQMDSEFEKLMMQIRNKQIN